jgi:DNA-directed RNA polymerase specialized sigma24 family protein
VNSSSEAVADTNVSETHLDIETLFRAHYGRVARTIARVVGDRARSEELAVEVFLKLWRNRKA